MMRRYIVLDKKRGVTPLEAIQEWKSTHDDFDAMPASYAGRLDPMASGKLLVLLGDECKKQKEYRNLDKEYEIEVLLDFSTDTGDVLGLPTYSGHATQPDRAQIKEAMRSVRGTHTVPYPAFSSKTVHGVPLFLYALRGTFASIDAPTHAETVHRIRLNTVTILPKDAFRERIRDALVVVPRSNEGSKEEGADFRQDAIRTEWETLFDGMANRSVTLLRFTVTCGSGTYMRTLAMRLAAPLGTNGFALSIHRTRIGSYHPLGFWYRTIR